MSVARLIPAMQTRALDLDRAGDFPRADLRALRDCGALIAPLPRALGGLGWGTELVGAEGLIGVLRTLGQGSLSVGRIYEAHVNALRLIVRYGTGAQAETAAGDAAQGHLFGLWVTDAPDSPLVLTEKILAGAKNPCSAAGHATRALVTARLPDGETRLLVIALRAGERVRDGGWDAHGMRATASRGMALDGIGIGPEDWIGEPGDYLREPDFSAGAWRSSAVLLGGLEALVGELRAQLVRRGRDGDPHQRARVGQALIARETAMLWVRRAAWLAEGGGTDAGDIANTVNLARIAAETAGLDIIRLTQRALGLAAFRRGELVELLFRDLAVYLRQPAPDEALTEAAAHFMQRDPPPVPGWP